MPAAAAHSAHTFATFSAVRLTLGGGLAEYRIHRLDHLRVPDLPAHLAEIADYILVVHLGGSPTIVTTYVAARWSRNPV